MAYKNTSTFLALLLISNVLLATTWQALAGRNIPKHSITQDKKEPEWLFHSDGHVYIPGIGRVTLPPKFGLTPQNPFTGGSTSGSSGGGSGEGPVPGGQSYVPGGDDTFVPNPGFEVPIPGSGGGGGGVPGAAYP